MMIETSQKTNIVSQFDNSPYKQLLLIAIVTLTFWIVISYVAFNVWIREADHRDFYPRWAGARLALFNGKNLYSEETTRLMQLKLYGRILPPEADQQAFAYPAQLVVELLPFWFINDVEVATAIWEGFSVILMVGTLLLLNSLENKTPIWVIIGLLLWHYSVLMFFQAQVTIIPLAAIGIGFWAYKKNKDLIVGLVLPFGLIKPELIILPIITFLLIAIHRQRFRILFTFMVAELTLFLGSILVAGWWIPDWLVAIRQYASYAKSSWAIDTALSYHPLLGFLSILLVGLVILLTNWDDKAAISASVPLGMLLLPQTLIWGLTMLVFPILLSWKDHARWGVFVIWSLGWILILGSYIPDWWKFQTLIMPILVLPLITISSWAIHDSSQSYIVNDRNKY